MKFRGVLVALLCLATWAAQAHRGNESQITLDLQAARVQGHWSIALHDLPSLLPSGAVANDDKAVTALIAAKPELGAQLLQRVRLSADGAVCIALPLRHEVAQRAGGNAWVLYFEARCAKTPARVTVDLRPLFELAPRHVLLMKLEAGAWVRAALFSADSAQQVFVPR
ncbi:MAG: hypothetical protein ABL916_22190 [Burkholderiaceae bacterium]